MGYFEGNLACWDRSITRSFPRERRIGVVFPPSLSNANFGLSICGTAANILTETRIYQLRPEYTKLNG